MEEDEDRIDPAEVEKAARTVVVGQKSLFDVSKAALDKDKKPVSLRAALSVHARIVDDKKADDDGDDDDDTQQVRTYNLPGGRSAKSLTAKSSRSAGKKKKKVAQSTRSGSRKRKRREKSKFIDDNASKLSKFRANIGGLISNATDRIDALIPEEPQRELPAWFNPAYRPTSEFDKDSEEPEILRWFNRLEARYELLMSAKQQTGGGRKAIEKRITLPETLEDGAMTVIDATSTRLLLLREGDIFFCTTPVCPTHAAPLNNGLFHEFVVHCPLYGCGFDIRTGEAVEGPNLVNIVTIPIAIYDANCITIDCPQQDELVADDSKKVSQAARVAIEPPLPLPVLVVVGGGSAAICACVTLRNYSYNGHILLFESTGFFPIDKRVYITTAADHPTVTSTTYKTPEAAALAAQAMIDTMLLKPYAWYIKHNIQFQPHRIVRDVRTALKEIILENGDRVSYDKLLIATGMQAQPIFRNLETGDLVAGCDLKNVFSAFDVAQARHAVAQSEGKRCVVVGSSVYAFELIAALRKKAKWICLVHTDERLIPELGPHACATFTNELKKSGVQLHLRHYLYCVNGQPGAAAEGNKVVSVILRVVSPTSTKITQGSYKLNMGAQADKKSTAAAAASTDMNDVEIQCDFVILCSQSRPSTDFLGSTDVKRSLNGYVLVDDHMEVVSSGPTAVKDIYACGECCQVQLPHIVRSSSASGDEVGAAYNVHGVKMKCATARSAALNLCGVPKLRTPLRQCPMEWSTSYGRSLIYAGYIDWLRNDLESDYDFVMHGSWEEEKYAVFYCRRSDGICDAALTANYVPTASMLAYIKSRVGLNIKREHLLPDNLMAPNLPRLGRTYLSQQLIPRYYAAVSVKRARVSVPQDLLFLAGLRKTDVLHEKQTSNKSTQKTSALRNAVDMHSHLLGPLFAKEQFTI